MYRNGSKRKKHNYYLKQMACKNMFEQDVMERKVSESYSVSMLNLLSPGEHYGVYVSFKKPMKKDDLLIRLKLAFGDL